MSQEEISTQEKEEEINKNRNSSRLNPHNKHVNFIENSLDYVNTYTPYLKEEKEKIKNEIDLTAENRQAKYSDLFKNLKSELREVLNCANNLEREKEVINEIHPSVVLINSLDKVPNFDSFQIQKQETDLFFTNSLNNNNNNISNLILVENSSELSNSGKKITVNLPPCSPKKTDHSEDLKKRLNNLKSASRTNLLKKSKTLINTTVEKLDIVKRMGTRKFDKNKTSNGKTIKEILELDYSDEDDTSRITLNVTQPHQVKSSKPSKDNLHKKQISNGATSNSAPKSEIEQSKPIRRFYTQTKPINNSYPRMIKKEDSSDNYLDMNTSNVHQDIQLISPWNNKDISNSQTFNSANNFQKHNITNENCSENPDKHFICNSILINNNISINNPNTGTSFYGNYTNNTTSPDITCFKTEEPVTEFKIELKNEGEKYTPSKESDINHKFKGILLKDGRKDKYSIPKKKSKPTFTKCANNMNTIESLPCQEDSDSEDDDYLKYCMINEESVVREFPVLNINANNLTNETIMGRNKKNKTEKILIHASSGKRIITEIRLETLENKDNIDQEV
jgi:hypothetical protein